MTTIRLPRPGRADAVIRPLVAADAAALFAAVRASHAALARWFPWCHAGYGPNDASARAAHCQAAWAAGTEYPFGLFDAGSGELLGCVGLSQINPLHRSANLARCSPATGWSSMVGRWTHGYIRWSLGTPDPSGVR